MRVSEIVKNRKEHGPTPTFTTLGLIVGACEKHAGCTLIIHVVCERVLNETGHGVGFCENLYLCDSIIHNRDNAGLTGFDSA